MTEIAPPGVRCAGCGGSFAPDARGIFRLHRTAIAARPSAAAGVTFALTPDWSGNEWLIAVHNFLHAFAGSDPHRLWITADPRQISLGAVLERLRPLLLPFGDLPFAEIFLSETPPDAGTALPLSSDRARVLRLQLRVVPRAGAGGGGAEAARSERRQGLLVAP